MCQSDVTNLQMGPHHLFQLCRPTLFLLSPPVCLTVEINRLKMIAFLFLLVTLPLRCVLYVAYL